MSTKLRCSALVAAGVLVASVGLAGHASAQPTTTIDPTAAVSLTIHKYEGSPAAGVKNDGTDQTANITNTKLAGVEFEVVKVGSVDLTTNAGLEAAKQVLPETAEGLMPCGPGVTGPCAESKVTVTTGADGSAKFSAASGGVGLYFVKEVDPASNTAEVTRVGTTPAEVVAPESRTPAAPFLVTLPLTDPVNLNAWMYDVHVYPKNTVDDITKEVSDAGSSVLGSDVVYTISASVNVGDHNGDGVLDADDLQHYMIGDHLDKHLTLKSYTLKLTDKNGTEVALTSEGTDPDYSYYEGTPGDPKNGSVWEFNQPGLTKLVGANGGRVTIVITAQVATMPADGVVPNQAFLVPNLTNMNTIPSTQVESKYGSIVLKKVDPNNTALTGAEFAVYHANAGSCDNLTGNPIKTGTTDANGLMQFEGLQLSNFYNGAEQTTLRSYCLVETKAPSGHELLGAPIKFNLTAAGDVTDLNAAYADTARASAEVGGVLQGGNLEVTNMPSNLGNRLPITGGQGIALFSILGAVVIIGGIAFYRASVRTSEN